MTTVFYWVGAVFCVGLVLLLAVSVHAVAWQRMWQHRDDWRLFISYTIWKKRHFRQVRDRRAAQAALLRRWAEDIEKFSI